MKTIGKIICGALEIAELFTVWLLVSLKVGRWLIETKTQNKGNKMPKTIQIDNETIMPVQLLAVTRLGRPGKIYGQPRWSVESGECQVEPGEDGKSCRIKPGAQPGEAVIKVTAVVSEDTNEEVSETIQLSVAPAKAVKLVIVEGTPELIKEDEQPGGGSVPVEGLTGGLIPANITLTQAGQAPDGVQV